VTSENVSKFRHAGTLTNRNEDKDKIRRIIPRISEDIKKNSGS
jgi:hypothetical protein